MGFDIVDAYYMALELVDWYRRLGYFDFSEVRSRKLSVDEADKFVGLRKGLSDNVSSLLDTLAQYIGLLIDIYEDRWVEIDESEWDGFVESVKAELGRDDVVFTVNYKNRSFDVVVFGGYVAFRAYYIHSDFEERFVGQFVIKR